MMLSQRHRQERDNGRHALRYAVFELYREYGRLSVVRTRAEGGFVIERSVRAQGDLAGPAGTARQMAALLERPLEYDAQVCIIFDTTHAALIEGAVVVERPDWNAEITVPEVEKALRHGVWSVEQQHRRRAASLLETHELQLALVDVDLVQLRLDGHRVVSPVGFRSRAIECALRETFVPRATWQQITARIPESRIVSISERGGMWAQEAAQEAHGPMLMIDVDEHATVVYRGAAGDISIQDTVRWGSAGIFEALAARFGLPAVEAPRLIERYSGGECSAAVAEVMGQVLEAELSVLLHTVEAHQSKQPLPVFVHSVLPLPSEAVLERVRRRHASASRFTILPSAPSTQLVVHYPRGSTTELSPSYDTALLAVMQVGAGRRETLLAKSSEQRMRWIAVRPS